MKKKIKIFYSLLISVCLFGCMSSNSGPKEIKLTKYNILDYLNLKISFDSDSKRLSVTGTPSDYKYSFSDYTGIDMHLYFKGIFDYDIKDRGMIEITLDVENNGSVSLTSRTSLHNYQSIVFNDIYVSDACGYVYLNGASSNGSGSYEFISNDKQLDIYNQYLSNVPKPGDETYSSDGCTYEYIYVNNQKRGLALQSAHYGDVIMASRSHKHNNEKITEVGRPGYLLNSGYKTNGEYQIYNDQITSMILGKYVERINDNALAFAKKLKTINFPSTLKYIGKEAFNSASLENGVDLPDGLEEIGNHAFSSTKLKTIFIPSSVTKMGDYPFKFCDDLVIYCEATSKPDSWPYTWDNYNDNTNIEVVWGATRNQAK